MKKTICFLMISFIFVISIYSQNEKTRADEINEVLLKNELDYNISTGSIDGTLAYDSTQNIPVNFKQILESENVENEHPLQIDMDLEELPITRSTYSLDTDIDTLTEPNDIPDYRIYFPTAINLRSPGNDEFYPIGVGIDEDTYQMTIYNRWGEIIFTTTDWDTHWKGRYSLDKGDYVPQGVYTYVVIVRDIHAKKHTYSGRITVFK